VTFGTRVAEFIGGCGKNFSYAGALDP
jgi:hypothetical protein